MLQISENSVVLMEDMDCILDIDRSDDYSKNSKEKEEKKKKLQKIMQLLDGIKSPSKTVFVATTNHKEVFDEALIRPGRFDLHMDVNLFDIEDAEEMCNRFDVDTNILQNVSFPLRPSELQNVCIQKYFEDIQ